MLSTQDASNRSVTSCDSTTMSVNPPTAFIDEQQEEGPGVIATASDAPFEFVGSDHKDWDQYVRQHPKGAIFHTAAMIRVFAATKDMEPFARAAVNADGKIVALLVSCHVKTLRRFSAVSSRAVQFAEPLCDPDPTGVAALTKLIDMHDHHMRSRALFCEVRPLCEPSDEADALAANGYQHCDYINYIINVQNDVDLLWGSMHKRLRQKIRSTLRKGVEIQDDNSPEGVQRLYRLLQASYRRARIPLLGQDLFLNTLAELPADCVRVRTAFQGDRPVASIISLIFGNRVFSWYGGTLRLNGISPFACIVWDDVEWACRHGYSHYDFGGAGWPYEDYGPRKFKASFGGAEVRFGRYMLIYSPLRLRLAKFGYKVTRGLGVWK